MKSPKSFEALSYRPYRRIFLGSIVSNVGTWIETVTIGIYMQTITKNATFVAAAMVAGYLPQALMALFAGPLADRLERRKILIFTNTCAALIACVLTYLVASQLGSPNLVIFLIFLTGFLNALSFPAWQGFLSDIMPKDKVSGALSLMFAQWNLGRILGPAIAAIFVSRGHYAQALGLNAASFFLVVLMVSLVRESHFQIPKHERKYKQSKSKMEIFLGGWQYIFSVQSNMRKSFLAYCLVVFFASPFIALIPNVADEVFGKKNIGTSLITTAQGIGAVIVSVMLTSFHEKYGTTRTQQSFFIGLPFVLIAFGLSPNLFFATPIALFFGVTYLGTLTSATLSSQLAAPPYLKGRISAAFMATLGLLFPLSALIQSVIVEMFGARILFISTGISLMFLLIAFGAFSKSYRLPPEYEDNTKMVSEMDDHGE